MTLPIFYDNLNKMGWTETSEGFCNKHGVKYTYTVHFMGDPSLIGIIETAGRVDRIVGGCPHCAEEEKKAEEEQFKRDLPFILIKGGLRGALLGGTMFSPIGCIIRLLMKPHSEWTFFGEWVEGALLSAVVGAIVSAILRYKADKPR